LTKSTKTHRKNYYAIGLLYKININKLTTHAFLMQKYKIIKNLFLLQIETVQTLLTKKNRFTNVKF